MISNMCSTTSTNSSNTSICNSSNFKAKLRRLKIEESILLQNINKCASQADSEINPMNDLVSLNFKKFLADIKECYNELKQLFQDVKTSTSSKEIIQSVDIDDIKKNTLELETKIKSLKLHLQTELNALKSTERQLNQTINDPVLRSYSRAKPKTQTAKYTEIVPSPVKTLMSSPLKSLEVHEFQEFMKSSKNRYGGWDEYHHNIFVNVWRKHFDVDEKILYLEEEHFTEENSAAFIFFLRDVLPRLIGVTEDDVKLHVRWYIKYLYLKNRQQNAIDKWRSNRRKMKSSNIAMENSTEKKCSSKNKVIKNNKITSTGENVKDIDSLNLIEDLISDHETRSITRECYEGREVQHNTNKEEINNFLKPTKQWNIRCTREYAKTEIKNNYLEDIKKLGIPGWRAGL